MKIIPFDTRKIKIYDVFHERTCNSFLRELFMLNLPYTLMNDEFDALVREYFYSFIELRPDYATVFGLHEYDKKMPSATKEAQETYIHFLRDYLQKFQDMPHEDVSPDRKIDHKLIISLLKSYLFQEDEIRQWEKDPDVTPMVGGALFSLFFREFAPFEERLESITARLQQCPQLIRGYKTRVETSFHLWVDMAKEALRSLPSLFETVSLTAQHKKLDTTELDEAAARTTESISEYMKWLDTVPCEGEPWIGKDLYEQLLQARELPLTADEILQIGEHYLESEKNRLRELASLLNPSVSVKEVLTHIRSNHPPTFEDALKEYKKTIVHVRELVLRKEFASIPENEHLIVMETPPFMRHRLPLAGYSPPSMFEKDQTGFYAVTPVEGSLQEHNYAAIMNVSVHEGYPGHHLQALWINKNPSLVRKLCFNSEYREGWAHYCEERMRDYGLSDYALQFMQTIYTIFRAVRTITDVKLHCREMAFDEAVSLYESETGAEHSIAVAEVKWCTKGPTGGLSYLIGKHLFLELQKDVLKHLREKYSDNLFHDAVLQAGWIPFTFLREELKLKGMF